MLYSLETGISNGAMEKTNRYWFKDLFIIFVSGALLFLGFAFARPLANPDEGRYVEIPREMIASGDYVTPRLNGLPYFYKPPLFYWMQCASIKMFGYNRTSLRLASSLMAVVGLCLTYAAARSLYGRRAGWFSACVLATSVLYYVMGLIVTLDMAVAVFISGALFSFIVAVKKSGIFRSVLFAMFFVFMGLAVMTKGVIGVLIPCAVAFLYVASGGVSGVADFFRKIGRRDWLFILLGILAFFAITVPWHVLVSIANPSMPGSEGLLSKNPQGQGFFWYYFIHEHILRYIDPSTSMRQEPFWYFLVLAPVGALPWILLLPRVVKNTLFGGQVDTRQCRNDFWFMALWIGFVVIFFSLSSSKLVPYITPIYPAFAFVLGVWGAKAWDERERLNIKVENYILSVAGIIGVIALVVAFFVLKRKPIDDAVIAFAWYSVFITAIILAAISVFALRYASNDNSKFWKIAVCGVAFLMLTININAPMGQRMCSESAADFVKANGAEAPLAIAFDYGHFQDFPVYMNGLVMLIGEPPIEQQFGWMIEGDRHKNRIFPDYKSLEAALKKHGKIWALIMDRDVPRLQKMGPLNTKTIYKNKRVMLVEISLKDAR